MKTRFLLPNYFLKIGWILFPIAILLQGYGFYDSEPKFFDVHVFAIFSSELFSESGQWFTIIKNNIFTEITLIITIVSLLFLTFSRQKNEDEYIGRLRMESLTWAIYINFFLLIFFTLFIYGIVYLDIVFYSMFSVLLFVVLRFNYVLYQIKRRAKNEK